MTEDLTPEEKQEIEEDVKEKFKKIVIDANKRAKEPQNRKTSALYWIGLASAGLISMILLIGIGNDPTPAPTYLQGEIPPTVIETVIPYDDEDEFLEIDEEPVHESTTQFHFGVGCSKRTTFK